MHFDSAPFLWIAVWYLFLLIAIPIAVFFIGRAILKKFNLSTEWLWLLLLAAPFTLVDVRESWRFLVDAKWYALGFVAVLLLFATAAVWVWRRLKKTKWYRDLGAQVLSEDSDAARRIECEAIQRNKVQGVKRQF